MDNTTVEAMIGSIFSLIEPDVLNDTNFVLQHNQHTFYGSAINSTLNVNFAYKDDKKIVHTPCYTSDLYDIAFNISKKNISEPTGPESTDFIKEMKIFQDNLLKTPGQAVYSTSKIMDACHY